MGKAERLEAARLDPTGQLRITAPNECLTRSIPDLYAALEQASRNVADKIGPNSIAVVSLIIPPRFARKVPVRDFGMSSLTRAFDTLFGEIAATIAVWKAVNMCFLQFDEDSAACDTLIIADGRTGAPFRVSLFQCFRQPQIEISAVWESQS